MDAVKVLGSLLSQRAARTGGNGAVLGQILNGIADANESRGRTPGHHPVDPRFDRNHHSSFEHIVRDSVDRHHRGGGRLPAPANQWVQQSGYVNPNFAPRIAQANVGRPPVGLNPPVVRHAPRPHHQPHHDHHSGLGYNRRAEIMIEAMVMAAQSDGKIDALEQDRILDQLQPLDQDEIQYLRREFGRRHDVHAFIHALPQGMEYEVYQVSLMAINLDSQLEANYLREFAKCLRIDPQVCNQIHQRCGAPCLF
ncbi:MAG: DUF533 domain-containing protein [Rubripirellula sp.]